MSIRRRAFLGGLASLVALPGRPAPVQAPMPDPEPAAAPGSGFAPVVPGRTLSFPRDHGAHPEFRTEWWYITGWIRPRGVSGPERGFQVTFFRARPPWAQANPSRFAPHQLVIAHAAIADPAVGRLVHDQRIARAGFGLVEAGEATTDVRLDDWRLALDASTYRARIPGRDFDLDLACTASGAPLLQGDEGYSRKGPLPGQASYYYSRPGLVVGGRVRTAAGSGAVEGIAWLDHEWSTQYMDPEAVGWDWAGINLDDGALMAFRMRGRDGGVRWAAATLTTDAGVRRFGPGEVSFDPLRRWRSPRTGASYPVAVEIRCGSLAWTLEPLMDDQELDSRETTGAVYWEGAVRAARSGRVVGRGYLELTGYVQSMRI